MKSNKCAYKVLIVIGSLMTISYIGAIWADDVCKVILNIVAMIGSGIFCSAIVSLIIEEKNKRIAREEKIKQREFILKEIRMSLKTYLFWEVDQLSQYYLLKIDNSLKNRKRIEFSIAEVISKLQEYLSTTMTPEELFYNTTNVTNPEQLSFIEKRNKYLYKDILLLLKKIEDQISLVLSNETFFYINNFLDNNTLNLLRDFSIIINDIITFSEAEHFELVIPLKKDLLDKVNDLLTCLGVDLEEKMNVFIWEDNSKI